ncbi:MAG: phytoene/squalene synthase family protein [Salibacteraceae bacterium]|nr:phytoene/squalene synthase family protein [Salibacteraceae bacterium]|tara:strand:+ start:43153 stop:43995 length:843 start_codon:yes stop_codon:yes gene_type:complete
MDAKQLFDDVSQRTSQQITQAYSTSFSLGISCLNPTVKDPIYGIYGFVRFADEIVDTFHDYDKKELLEEFRQDTFKAINRGISLNPILNSFQHAINDFNIDHDLIHTFLDSMEMDLQDVKYTQANYEKYILGSAEVVGLMCLKVFVIGDDKLYHKLKPNAMKLGAAFQKINFLRDVKDDYEDLGRNYFPNVNIANMTNDEKATIEADIQSDFDAGYEGILQLPKRARFGVYLAYVYYFGLFKKIQNIPSSQIKKERIRIPNIGKYGLFVRSYVRHNIGLL